MAYRAPELFDVKTGVTLDEKVDIWVSDTPTQIRGSSDVDAPFPVAWMYAVRVGVPPLSLRESSNGAAGGFNSHGSHERTVQTPPERLFPRSQKLD